MKSKLCKTVSLLPVCAVFALVVCIPAAASAAVRSGLELCAGVIIPSLFPFFVLSALLSALGLPSLLARVTAPALKRLRLPPECCMPLLMGLTGGYPIGAAATAELVRSGSLSPRQGERLLPFCNNTGPAFIIGAVGSGVFGSATVGALLYFSHAASAILCALLLRPRTMAVSGGGLPEQTGGRTASFASALSASVKSAALSIVNVCAFVVFFSVITGILDYTGLLTRIVGELSYSLGLELHFTRALITGIIELGGGIGAMRGLLPTPANLALASFILGFGGLSVHCQTAAVIEGTDMKCVRHFAGRILAAVMAAAISCVLSMLLRS